MLHEARMGKESELAAALGVHGSVSHTERGQGGLVERWKVEACTPVAVCKVILV